MTLVTTGGSVVASGLTATPTPNNPPTITSTPDPTSFVFGVPSEYPLDPHMDDVDGDPLFVAGITVPFPDGITLRANANDNALVYDGVGAVNETNGHIMTITDLKDTSAPSSAFDIKILSSANFVSDNKIWGDNRVTIGTVPGEYAGFSMLRTICAQVNLHEDSMFTLSAGSHEVIIGLPTLNNHAIHQPDFMSSASYTSKTGTIMVPHRDEPVGASDVPVTVYYYSVTIVGGTPFVWRPTISDIELQLSYFMPFFLFPPGVTLSGIFPELNKVLPNISTAYVAPLSDAILWEKTPSTRPATTHTASDWDDIETLYNSGLPDDSVIEVPAATYNDEAILTLTHEYDEEHPVWIVPPETTLTGATVPTVILRGGSRIVWDESRGCRLWGIIDDQGTGNSNDKRFNTSSSKYVSIENVHWDGSSADNEADAWEYASVTGEYCRVTNVKVTNKRSRGNCFNVSPITGDNFATRFHILQYIECDGFNDQQHSWVGQNNAFIRLGGNNNFAARMHVYVRLSRFKNWNVVPDDAEFMVIKANGMMLVQNLHESNLNNAASAGFHPRTASWVTGFGNTVLAKSNNSNTHGIQVQGNDDSLSAEYLATNHVYGRNYVEDFDGPNGWLQVNQVSSTSTNRWKAKDCLIAEVYAPNCTDQVIRFSDSSNPDTPSGIFLKAIAVKTTTPAVIEEYDSSVAVSWEGSMLNGSSHGFDISGLPVGVVEDDPLFFDRGDGMLVSDHASLALALAVALCIPFSLLGDNIPDLGTTYNS